MMNLNYDMIQYDTIRTSIKNDVSHITVRCCVKNHRRPRSPDFEKLRLGIFEILFRKYTSRVTPVLLEMQHSRKRPLSISK